MKLQMKPKPNRNSVCLNQLIELSFFYNTTKQQSIYGIIYKWTNHARKS